MCHNNYIIIVSFITVLTGRKAQFFVAQIQHFDSGPCQGDGSFLTSSRLWHLNDALLEWPDVQEHILHTITPPLEASTYLHNMQ